MKPVIVIVASGVNDCTEWITPKLFKTETEAKKFITSVNDVASGKYWTYAEIVKDGQQIEPCRGQF